MHLSAADKSLGTGDEVGGYVQQYPGNSINDSRDLILGGPCSD